MRRRGRSRRANAGLPHAQDGACAREARPHGWSGSGPSGKPAENHTKPATLLHLTLSDSGGRGGSEDYAAPESRDAASVSAHPHTGAAAVLAKPPARLRAAPARFRRPAPARRGTPRPAPAPGSARRRRSVRPTRTPPSSSGLFPEPAGRVRSPATGPVLRLGHCQVSSFPFTQVHQRGHKGDFFQREDRVIKSKVHDLLFCFMKRWSRLWVARTRILELQFCFLDLPGTSQSRRLELQHYTLTGIIFCFRERCEELCESRVMVLPENTSVPAGVRSTLDLVQSHSRGPIWVNKTVTEIRNKTPQHQREVKKQALCLSQRCGHGGSLLQRRVPLSIKIHQFLQTFLVRSLLPKLLP
ncbi:uncharacterized protein [Haliaeetus albicilla]|uniref:uncharacterized protein n=1 Tax=Haliaeetus albicilla TaxID=8969 RepID=UPI0037E7B97D